MAGEPTGGDERGRARGPGKGSRLGPYTIVRELGRGAMGVVYLGEHAELGHRHAIKVLNPALLEDKTALRRFELEMENLARVDGHPGIVRVHSAGRTAEGAPWFAMEFVQGRTFTQAVKAGLPRSRSLDIVLQVARALAHAHDRGLLHRDVKPDNVLVGDDGQARLTDFGLARVALTPERLTRSTELLGTPYYMAPEQANPQAGKVGPWTDVYACGAVLYEVLTGRPPHDGATTVEVCTKLLNDPIMPPRERVQSDDEAVAAIHPAVEEVVLRALGRRPQDRYANGAALAQALEAALGEANAPPPAPRPRALVVVLVTLAIASVVLALAAVGTVAARRDAELERAAAVRREAAGLEALLRRGRTQEVLDKVAALSQTREAAPRTAELAQAWAEVDEAAGRARAQRDDGAFASRLRSARAALAMGRTNEALEALKPADLERDFPERATILALTGEAAAALAASGPATPPPARARIAAWAGDAAAARAALAAVTPPARGRALGRVLEAFAPGAAPPPGAPEEDDGAWGKVARAEAAAALGLAGLAAHDAWPGREAERDEDPDARLALATARVRAGIARGQGRAYAARVVDALREEGHDPFERAEALAALLEAGVKEEVPATFEGGVPGEAARVAPTHPGIARALWRRQVVAGTAGPPPWGRSLLDRARDVAHQRGSSAGLRALAADPSSPPTPTPPTTTPPTTPTTTTTTPTTTGADPSPAGPRVGPGPGGGRSQHLDGDRRSFIDAERALCARGADGPGGLFVARAADLASAADLGASPDGARAALGLLELATRLRPESPLVAASVARAELVLHQERDALAAANRAMDLAPGDPRALGLFARAVRALVDGDVKDLDAVDADQDEAIGVRADLARATTAGDPDLDLRAAQALAPVVRAWDAALAAAEGRGFVLEGGALAADPGAGDAGGAAGSPTDLEREARLGLAAALGERARHLLRGARPDEARPLLDRAREALAPLLGGLDPAAVAEARADLARALEVATSGAGEADARAAEDALAARARGATPAAREALLLGAALRLDGDGQAWSQAHLALAGDLPARALLEAGAALGERDAGARRRRLERAASLAPLAQVRVAALAQTGFERSPAGLDALAAVVLDAPEVLPLVVWLLGALDPGGAEADLAALDRDAAPGPGAAAPRDDGGGPAALRRVVARALGRFSLPMGDPGRSSSFVPRVRARASEAGRALGIDPDAVAPRALRALALLQLAQVYGRGARDERRAGAEDPGGQGALADDLIEDAAHDLAVARAARPDAPGLAALAVVLAQSKDALASAGDEAVARGFGPVSVERLRATLGLSGSESLGEEAVGALRAALEPDALGPAARARSLCGKLPALGLSLLGVEVDRALDPLSEASTGELEALARALDDGAVPDGDIALARGVAARRALARSVGQRRAGSGVASDARAATLREAAEAALLAGVRARRAGDSPARIPLRGLSIVPVRLPSVDAVTRLAREVVAMGQPVDGARAAAWLRLRAPEQDLDVLGRAVEGLVADGKLPRPSTEGPMDPADRALARLACVQDAAAQARAATEALALKRWAELSLALDRALAFDPDGAPGRTGARLVRAVRRLAPRDNPQGRARALRAAWRLADVALVQAGPVPALRGERADVLLDLVAACAPDAEEAARALDLARLDAEAARPATTDAPEVALAGWWRLLRAGALDGQPQKAREAALALKAALPAGGREAFVREVETDPALARIRALPEVEPVLRDLGLATW